MVVLEVITVVSSILDTKVMDSRAQYTLCASLESFIILKCPLQYGAVFLMGGIRCGKVQAYKI